MMAANYWIKWYCEILDDPKMATLPDRLWRRFSELCLLAGKINKGGWLPETRQIAWALRMSTDDLDLDLRQLERTDMLRRCEDGWVIVNFAKRQAPVPAADRMKQMRKRKQSGQYYDSNNNVTDDVTNQLRNVTQITDTDTDTDTYGVTSLSNAFVQATGILPYNLEEWTTADQEMTRQGVTPADVEMALKKMDVEKLTYTHLSSVKKTAIWVKSRREKHQPIFDDDQKKNGRLLPDGV